MRSSVLGSPRAAFLPGPIAAVALRAVAGNHDFQRQRLAVWYSF